MIMLPWLQDEYESRLDELESEHKSRIKQLVKEFNVKMGEKEQEFQVTYSDAIGELHVLDLGHWCPWPVYRHVIKVENNLRK